MKPITLFNCSTHNGSSEECEKCLVQSANECSKVYYYGNPAPKWCCCKCGKEGVPLLLCQNSCDENPSIVLCKNCIDEIFG
jgi:hypothetical protein